MIKYQKGFKYQLARDYVVQIPIFGFDVETRRGWIKLEADGKLTLRLGFAWDGSSGPAIDTKTDMQASAEHDALCKLIRYDLLPMRILPVVDRRYRDKCIEDGKWKWWANLRYKALSKLKFYARPKYIKKIFKAP